MSLPDGRRVHGGPGPDGPARFDFSTTANALGPHRPSLAAIRRADHSRYPDPSYRDLRARVARLHGVAPARVLFAASASEFIFRCTAIGGRGPVCVPRHGFGDYASAARAFGRPTVHDLNEATLAWFADPGSPRGETSSPPRALPDPARTLCVLDRACAPLRLDGGDGWSARAANRVFRLHSPNKALGLTGLRAAYAIAPSRSVWTAPLEAACPSWPLGAASVALLETWTLAETQAWVADGRIRLAAWKRRQDAGLAALGFRVEPSVGNFGLVRPPPGVGGDAVEAALAEASVAWRETTSFGLPGAWRVSVQRPVAQRRLFAALEPFGTRERADRGGTSPEP